MAQGLFRYRCFLPDLTEFTVPPCTGPNYQQSTSRLIRQPKIGPMLAIFLPSDALAGGEGGIRTLGTLIRGTHDFQSCTFNRSVTSPFRNVKHLRAPPCSSIPECLPNVSTRGFLPFSLPIRRLHQPSTGNFQGQRRKAEMMRSARLRILRLFLSMPSNIRFCDVSTLRAPVFDNRVKKRPPHSG